MTVATAPPDVYEDLPEREGEAARLSFLRLLLAIVLVGGAGYGAYLFVKSRINGLGTVTGTWFAPYVDVTVPPTYQFQLPSENPARQSVLGFVVQKNGSACTPSWGGVYTLDQADQQLNFDSRLAEIKAEGGLRSCPSAVRRTPASRWAAPTKRPSMPLSRTSSTATG